MLCSSATARSNSTCAGCEHEIGKSTVPSAGREAQPSMIKASAAASIKRIESSSCLQGVAAALRSSPRRLQYRKWTCEAGERLLDSPHERLWPVLSRSGRVGGVRAALDAADHSRAVLRALALQRDPSRHSADLAHSAHGAVALARGRGSGGELDCTLRPGARI